ncbi:MAG: hypothetical protein D6757_00715 [Alphaproteobacteria bacterium]|nr:MAG: hypothetical protein D6757_00715 [Alphaproteobacteria bacterium]
MEGCCFLTALQVQAEPLSISSNLRAALHYASGSSELDGDDHLVGGTLYLDGAVEGEWWRIYVDSELQWADATSGRDFPGNHAFRQVYMDLYLGNLDLRVGRQLIVWGRADRINPTDVISPRDFRFLSADFQGQRFGADAISARLFLGPSWSFQLVMLPLFERTILPQGILPPDLPPPKTIGPDDGFDNPQVAIKLERIGEGVDFSFSGYRGFSLAPAVTVFNGAVIQVHPEFFMGGGDFSAVKGKWGLRGEVAGTFYKERMEFPFGTAPENNIFAVVGVERRLSGDDRLLVQFLFQQLVGTGARSAFPSPEIRELALGNDAIFGQFHRTRTGVSLTLLGTRLDSDLRFELAGAVHFNDGDWALRPRIEWAMSDRWTVVAVADLFGGNRNSRFGVLEQASRLFVQLRRAF